MKVFEKPEKKQNRRAKEIARLIRKSQNRLSNLNTKILKDILKNIINCPTCMPMATEY
jgi:hypothetical protein